MKSQTWTRYFPGTWENSRGYRTDISYRTLTDHSISHAHFIARDEPGQPGYLVPMDAMRPALLEAPRRSNGMVGPFNVDPVRRTVNGRRVPMESTNSEPHIQRVVSSPQTAVRA
jgi:hypothetical protein